jgi:hypothetical protein
MSIIAAVFLLLALIVPGHAWPPVSWSMVFALVWFILFMLEKTGALKLP